MNTSSKDLQLIYESIQSDDWKHRFIHETLPHNGVNDDFLFIAKLDSWDDISDVSIHNNRVYKLDTKTGVYRIQLGNGVSIRFVWGDNGEEWERDHRGFLVPVEDNSWREE